MQSDHFPFLGVNTNSNIMADMRCRTTFYTALGRLLLVDLGEDEEKFDQFMLPLTGETYIQNSYIPMKYNIRNTRKKNYINSFTFCKTNLFFPLYYFL